MRTPRETKEGEKRKEETKRKKKEIQVRKRRDLFGSLLKIKEVVKNEKGFLHFCCS